MERKRGEGKGGGSKFDPLTVTPLSVVSSGRGAESINLRVIYYHVCQEGRISHRVSAIEFQAGFLANPRGTRGRVTQYRHL